MRLKMKYQKLGKSEIEVSRIAVGCMRMGGMAAGEAESLVKHALDKGINHFDHADIYGGGSCEEIFGDVLKKNPGMREKMILQSKCGIIPGKCYDNSREYIISATEGILKRLGTDYLDMLLIHRPDALVEPEEVAEAFDKLHEQGKVRNFGVSNHSSMQMELLQKYVKQPLLTDQLQFSITNSNMVRSGLEVNMETDGAADRDGRVLDYCRWKEITVQVWSPFQYGMFEGVFLGNEKYAKLNEVIKRIGEKYSVSDTTIATAWILRHPAQMQVIAGSMKEKRIDEICAACEIELTREEWYELYLAAGHILP